MVRLNMKELILCLIALHVATARVHLGGGELVEISSTQQQVYGKYISRDGSRGIVFFSGADDYLLIRTLSGKTIVETSPIVERDDGDKLRSVYILGHEYLQHATSPSHPDQPVGHEMPLSDAIHVLMNVEEIGLLEGAAEAVGQKGVTGNETPAVLPFYVFALRVTELQTGATPTFTSNSTRVQRNACEKTCPPCTNHNCLGMCGKGCSCWPWICGDCCWHVGCYYHSKCCAQQFFQTACFFPFGFNCNKSSSGN